MKKKGRSMREGIDITCKLCDKKLHYRYTREELENTFYRPNGPLIKPCMTDFCMDYVWLNYKLENILK